MHRQGLAQVHGKDVPHSDAHALFSMVNVINVCVHIFDLKPVCNLHTKTHFLNLSFSSDFFLWLFKM